MVQTGGLVLPRPRMLLRSILGLAPLLALVLTSACKPPACPQKKYEAPDERFVFFTLGKIDVLPDGYYALGHVAAQLEADPALHVLIVGHADQQGKSEHNRELSFKRARVARKVLIDHGIKDRRILIAAPREQSDSTLAQLNRRADLFLYDPLQDEASKRIGYPIDVKSE